MTEILFYKQKKLQKRAIDLWFHVWSSKTYIADGMYTAFYRHRQKEVLLSIVHNKKQTLKQKVCNKYFVHNLSV